MSDSDSDSDYDGGDGGGTSTSIQRCLATIGIDAIQDLSHCTSLREEFTAIKRAYFKKILVVHPDKGGDAAEFRDVNSSWELIRKLYEDQAIASFATAAESTQDRYDYDYGNKSSTTNNGGGMPWRYYYDAAEADVPPYKVELARSGRSRCKGTKSARKCSEADPFIGKGEIRIGSIDAMSGSYGRWIHLECWRVPSRIWLGVPQDDGDRSVARCLAALSGMNEVQFTGFNDLSPHNQHQIATHVADKSNWASLRGRRPRAADLTTTSTGGGGSYGSAGPQPPRGAAAGGYSGGASSASGYSRGAGHLVDAYVMAPSSGAAMGFMGHHGSALVAQSAGHRGFYVIPRPGVNGARADSLKGKTIVMTGLFPEIGGGMGLNQGKDRLKSMCESFGARVTSAISGKTDILIVGKEPGASKVGKASASAKCQLVSLEDLTLSIQGTQQIESAGPPEIEAFSSGYNGNGLGRIKSSGAAHRVLVASQAPKKAPAKKAPAKKAPAKKAPAKKAPAKKAPAKKAPAKRTPAKAKPKPKAKKSAAAKKTASGSKKKGSTAAKASTPNAKKSAAKRKKSAASGRKKVTAAKESSTDNEGVNKKAKVSPAF